jgi:hypothetical protein
LRPAEVDHHGQMDVMNIAGTFTAMAAQQTATDVSTAVLAKTLQTEKLTTAGLVNAMSDLPPFGALGRNVDVRA